jgi:hypothetical protein
MQKKDLIFQYLKSWNFKHTMNFVNANIDHHLLPKHQIWFPFASDKLHLSTIETSFLLVFKAETIIQLILHISITTQRLYKNYVHYKLHKTIILQ